MRFLGNVAHSMWKINYIKKQNIVFLLVIITSYVLLFINRLWVGFVDEADNFVGGWLISKGYVLYKDMFSQHMPFPYYYASLLIKLGLNDVSGLRIGWSLTILFFWILIIIIFKDKINYKLLCILIFLSAITHPIFWGHMFLADSFFAYSILIIFLYFFSNPQLNFNIKDKIVIASMIYISIMSTLISIYPIMLLGIYYIVKKVIQFYVEKTNIKNKLAAEIKFALIIVTPFILTLIFFYSTGSLREFFNQAYLFNKIYYFQFTGTLTKPQFFEPIKTYSSYIFYYISNNDWLINGNSFLWAAWDHNPPLFFKGFLVISNLVALVILWKKKNATLAIIYFLFLGFLRIRTGLFHETPYYLSSLFSVSLILTETYELYILNKQKIIEKELRQLTNGIKFEVILTMLYGFLAILFLGVISHAYVSNGSGIGSTDAYANPYDRIVQTLTQPEDAIWVAPFEPSLYFTNSRLPASRHTYYLPWNALSDKINEELIADLKVKKPPIIIFNRDLNIGRYAIKDYGKVVDDYLLQDYQQVDPDDPTYKNIYLINTKRNQLLDTLNNSGLYQPADANQLDKSAHIGEIVDGLTVVQTFTPEHQINRIDLMLATFARKNHGRIIFHLKENLTGDDIFNKIEYISEIKDNSWYIIYFPQFNNSMIGKKIYLIIEAPESKPGDAITIYSSKNDSYKSGELYINGQPTGKDITFRTYWNPYSNVNYS